MKGARFVLPGCTGFHTLHPEWGEFRVIDLQHYRVICQSLKNPLEPTIFIPMRYFIVLNFPKKDEENP